MLQPDTAFRNIRASKRHIFSKTQLGPMLRNFLIACGSNLGKRQALLTSGLIALLDSPGARLLAVSDLYETDPVGGPPQPAYLNACALIEDEATPREFFERMAAAERGAGRERGQLHGPRTLDLDLLLVDQLRISEPDLVVPHPRMHERAFVLIPAAQIAGEWRHPTRGVVLAQLAAPLAGDPKVRPFGRWVCAGV